MALGGCWSSPPGLVESADKKCDAITDRFTGDLAYGKAIGSDDLTKVRKRNTLIRDPRKAIKALPQPDTAADRAALNTWLGKLDAYAKELYTMHSVIQNLKPGMELLLAMNANIVKDSAEEAGAAAKKAGLHSCARVKRWEYLVPD
ncbi:hypothetical protein GCM10017744_037320 [Streptomyces antimycoticus]|uniref:Uncharacterized protein n=1 Tax=Streptomyces antimycoticus TaxID=68175 RepID=A0A4D4KH31_9ACTN|nr:hypothetical protein [Streptomyces antimycoticus]GDY45647.1 hypothetical protein SANT12839_065290 [Streptomyces antimycoticus]